MSATFLISDVRGAVIDGVYAPQIVKVALGVLDNLYRGRWLRGGLGRNGI